MTVSVMSSTSGLVNRKINTSENLENYNLNLFLLSLTFPTDNAALH